MQTNEILERYKKNEQITKKRDCWFVLFTYRIKKQNSSVLDVKYFLFFLVCVSVVRPCICDNIEWQSVQRDDIDVVK